MLVLQHGVGWSAELLRVSAPTFDAVATRYGLDRVSSFQRCAPDRKAHWEKVVLLRHYLAWMNEGDVILWADADTLYLRPDVDPRTALPDGYDLACNGVKWGWLNMGLVFIRVSQRMRDFFERVWELGPVPGAHEGLQDEARINAELPASGLKVFTLPPEWHSFERGLGVAENPIIQAWHGTPKQTTLKRMKEARRKAGV